MPRYNNKKNFNNKSSKYQDNYIHPSKGEPTDEGKVNDFISVKANRGLPNSSVTLKVDPYTNSLPTSRPYPIINVFNRKIGGKYTGDRNLDGGNVSQYPNSVTSGFRKVPDSGVLALEVNYRYIPRESQPTADYVGKELINEQRKAVSEATSILASTTFTQMDIYKYVVETDMPMGDAVSTTISGKTVYNDIVDVIYASANYYQICIQEILNTLDTHNSFRLKQGEMIRDQFSASISKLNSFFGLMNKKSFTSLLDSITLSIPGEFVDTEWNRQIGALCLIPSRRSESMFDPMLELVVNHSAPTYFRLHIVDNDEIVGTVFDSDQLRFQVPSILDNAESYSSQSIFGVCRNVKIALSAEKTKLWARQNNTATATARFNRIKEHFDAIISFLNVFKIAFTDIREVFDTLGRTGINSWVKGFKPAITNDTNAFLFWNLVIDDIYKIALSSANEMAYNDDTKRWRSFTLWNLYSGTPEYDSYSGGAFLSLSLKDISAITDTDNTRLYLPRVFSAYSEAYFCTRDGIEFELAYDDDVVLSNDPVFCRLVPLTSQTSWTMKVPKFVAPGAATDQHLSHMIRVVSQIFGMGRMSKNDTTYSFVDSDTVAVYSYEIEDLTNQSIAYARHNNVFRAQASMPVTLGFSF